MSKIISISFACLVALHLNLYAQDLDTIMVTATKTPRPLFEVPVDAVVITQEDIQNSAALNVDELLESVSGINVVHNLGILSSGSTSKVIIRGVGGTGESRTLLLVDGVPMNDAFSGAVEWNQIPLESIERVEILKGVGSALYGSNAMGGTINIITKNPSQNYVKTSLSYASMNTQKGNLQAGGKIGDLGYFFNGELIKSDGYIVEKEEDRESNTIKTALKRKNVLGKLTYQLDDSSDISLMYSYYNNEDDGVLKMLIDDYNPGITTNQMYQLQYKKKFENGSDMHISVFTQNNALHKDYLKDSTTIEYEVEQKTDEKGILTKYSYYFDNHTVTIGADMKFSDVESQNLYTNAKQATSKGQQDYYALFVQDEYFFGKDVVVNIGARYDYYKNHKGSVADEVNNFYENYETKTLKAFNPKLALLYNISDFTTIKSSIGTAFRAPSINDLYKSTIKKNKISAGNPNLDPETIRSIDIGVVQKFAKSGLLSVTGYHSIIEDYIYSILAPKSSPYYKEKINVGKAKIQGIETELEYSPLSELKLIANYSYTQATIEEFEEDTSLEGKDIIRVPKHKASFKILYHDPMVCNFNLTTNYVGSRYEDDSNQIEYQSYITTDIKISKKINQNFDVALTAIDLFNEAYEEKYLSPGRVVMATLTITF